jgi:hypothetical protein
MLSRMTVEPGTWLRGRLERIETFGRASSAGHPYTCRTNGHAELLRNRGAAT